MTLTQDFMFYKGFDGKNKGKDDTQVHILGFVWAWRML